MRRALMELPSRLVNRYLRDGGDLVVLPIGSVEELGPHLPVGGRCFAAEAFAMLLAEAGDGLRLPVVPYGPAGTTFDRPGSVDVPDAMLNEYVRGVMDDLHAQGFRRIVLVTFLDYARFYLPQEFFEDHGVSAAGIHLGEVLDSFGTEELCGVDDMILGALRILGREDLVEKCMKANAELLADGRDYSIKSAAARLAGPHLNVACRAAPGEYPFVPREGLSPEKGERVIRAAVAGKAGALGGLRSYNEYLARRTARGFERGDWFRRLDDGEGRSDG